MKKIKHPITRLPIKTISEKEFSKYKEGGPISADEAFILASPNYDDAIEQLVEYQMDQERLNKKWWEFWK